MNYELKQFRKTRKQKEKSKIKYLRKLKLQKNFNYNIDLLYNIKEYLYYKPQSPVSRTYVTRLCGQFLQSVEITIGPKAHYVEYVRKIKNLK